MRQKGFFLSLKIKKNSLGFSRFGSVISKKVSKKAVERNKIRRRIYGIMQKDFMDKVKKGWDILFIVSPSIKDKKGKELEEIMKESFEEFDLLCK